MTDIPITSNGRTLTTDEARQKIDSIINGRSAAEAHNILYDYFTRPERLVWLNKSVAVSGDGITSITLDVEHIRIELGGCGHIETSIVAGTAPVIMRGIANAMIKGNKK